jgi:hypothetical protein
MQRHLPLGATYTPVAMAQMQQLGLQFQEQCPYSPESVHVDLPPDWRIEERDQYIVVIDQRNRERVQITAFTPDQKYGPLQVRMVRFYERRLQFQADDTGQKTLLTITLVSGSGQELIRWKRWISYPPQSRGYFAAEEQMLGGINEQLTATYPRWEDPLAYWDE